jgi:ABC-2 type transport system permease protein
MTHATYLRYETLRMLRNWKFLVFSLAFPLILFFVIAGPRRHADLDGVPVPLYFMTGMAAWGTMSAVVASGARIAAERAAGWTRQMRITPLPERTYFGGKILGGYGMALVSIAALYLAGTAFGVRLAAHQWLTMTGLLLVALIPFAVLGILLGHLLRIDAIGPALGGIVTLFALLGGAWGQLASGGVLHKLIEWVPSYWLVQAGASALGHGGWPPARAWIVVAAWTAALALLAMRAYRRDTARS